MFSYRWLVCVVSLVLLVFGCATEPEQPQPAPDDRWQPRLDTAELYDIGGAAVPEDTDAVLAVTWPKLWDALGASLLPLANPDAEPGEVGTVKGLRDELSEMWRSEYGFDSGKLEGGLYTMDQGGISGGVLVGELSIPDGAEVVEAGDHEVMKLSAGAAGMFNARGYAAPLDAAEPAFVFADDEDQIEAMLDAAEANGHTPADTEITELMETTDGGGVAAAARSEFVDFVPELGVDAMPDRGVISMGDELRMTLFGDDEQLERVAELLDGVFESAREQIEENYRDSDDPFMGALYTYGFHGMEGLVAQLDPEFDDGRLQYEANAEGGVIAASTSIMLIVAAHEVGGMVEDGNRRTAQMELAQIEQMIETYYMTEQQLPEKLEDLTEGPHPITHEVPADPWGNEYIYEVHGERDFEVYSAGPDGEPGTDNDIRPR